MVWTSLAVVMFDSSVLETLNCLKKNTKSINTVFYFLFYSMGGIIPVVFSCKLTHGHFTYGHNFHSVCVNVVSLSYMLLIFTLSSSLQNLECSWPWYHLASSGHSTIVHQSYHTDPQLSFYICVVE